MPTVQFQATVTGDHFPNTVTPGAAHRRCRLHRATQRAQRATQHYTTLHNATQSYTELYRATQSYTESYTELHRAT